MNIASLKNTENIEKSILQIAKEKLFRHSCQLFRKGGKYNYYPWGSSVLIEFRSHFYLITASHVTEFIDEQDNLFLITSNGMLPISGELNETDLEHDKNIDLAYVKLDNELAQILNKTYDYLPKNMVELNHNQIDTKQYLTLGFPEKNIRIDKENKIIRTGSSSFLHKLMKEKVYKRYSFDKNMNFIVEYAGKGYDLATNVKKQIIRRPHGMSGCGLWFLYVSKINGLISIDYALIGIMTEYIEKPYDVLIGTKIDFIIEKIMS